MAPAGRWRGIREDLSPLRRRDVRWVALAAPIGIVLFAWRAQAADPAVLAPAHPIGGAAWGVAAAGYAGWGALSAALALIDVRAMRLPNRLLGLAALWLLGCGAVAALLAGDPPRFGWAALLAAGAAALCALLWLSGPRSFGGGDAKLAPICVFAVAWADPGAALLVFPLAVALATVPGVLAALRTPGTALPFGPALIAPSWIALALPSPWLLGAG